MNLFHDYTFQVVILGATMLGVLSGVIGSFTVLRGQALLGDGISHCALPGVVLAFLVTGAKSTVVLLLGGLVFSLLSLWAIHLICAHSKLTFDTALTLVLSVFFGLGLVFLTQAQKQSNASQAGLDRFLYGQVSALMAQDLRVIFLIGTLMCILLALTWPTCSLVVFDPVFAHTVGIPVRGVHGVLSALTVTVILLGLQVVGVVLTSALLVAPAVSARQWVNRLFPMVGLAGFFGGLSGFLGTWISTWFHLSTGPVIVICASFLAFSSVLLAPNRGLLVHSFPVTSERSGFHEPGL